MNTQYYRRQPHGRPRAPLILGIVVAAALLAIGLLSVLHRAPRLGAISIGELVPTTVVHNLTEVSAVVWQRVGTNQATPAERVKSTPTPTLLYIGAEGCPFCAAERWPVIVALSRFGHFSGLTFMQSSALDEHPNTPTFSFLHATYHSAYIRVALMETAGRHLGPNGFYPPLMKLSRVQQETFNKYDRFPYVPKGYAGAIPFVLVGHRYLWIGSSVNPSLLDQRSWAALSRKVYAGQGAVGKNILANANALTAAICATDGGRPRSVCRLIGHAKVPIAAAP